MKKDNEIKNENTKVAEIAKTQSILDFLNIQEEEVAKNEAFVKHTITAKVSGYRLKPDEDGKIMKVQIKTAEIDEDNGSLIENTFTLTSEKALKEADIKALKGKHIQVQDVTRYAHIDRDFKGNEKSRTYTFGALYKNMEVLGEREDLELFDLKSYVRITLNSVANIMKAGKETGDVKLISIKENEDGTIQTFTCVLKQTKELKYNKEMFEPLKGKELIINYIEEYRRNNETFYSTKVAPEVTV